MSDDHTVGASAESIAGTAPIAMFLDFDGTLVDLAETPDAIAVADDLITTLAQTAATLNAALVVVSGREVRDIDAFLSPLKLPVAGSHGAHRRRADGSEDLVQAEVSNAAQAMADALAPLVHGDSRLLLERKDGGVALHYRRAPERAADCRSAMQEVVANTPGFRLLEGKMVLEARQHHVDKGEAVRAFMAEPPFAGRIPVFLGDDVTDEDGFAAAQQLGGLGIKVGAGETAAHQRIADVAAVHALLRRIAAGHPFDVTTQGAI